MLLEWHNAAAVFQEPVPTHVGLALLTHQLGYFDILPLYVVLMLMAPVFALIDRYAPHLVLPISLLIYGLTLGFQIAVPTWPVEGEWFFNPLAWQLIFVLGFVLARDDGIGGFRAPPYRADPRARLADRGRRHCSWPIRLVARPDQAAESEAVLPAQQDLRHAAPHHPVPGADRGVVGGLSVYPRFASRLVDFLSMLGRNSLYVFCVGSILSLAGQIMRFLYQGNIYSRHRCGNLAASLSWPSPHGFRNGAKTSRKDREGAAAQSS